METCQPSLLIDCLDFPWLGETKHSASARLESYFAMYIAFIAHVLGYEGLLELNISYHLQLCATNKLIWAGKHTHVDEQLLVRFLPLQYLLAMVTPL